MELIRLDTSLNELASTEVVLPDDSTVWQWLDLGDYTYSLVESATEDKVYIVKHDKSDDTITSVVASVARGQIAKFFSQQATDYNRLVIIDTSGNSWVVNTDTLTEVSNNISALTGGKGDKPNSGKLV